MAPDAHFLRQARKKENKKISNYARLPLKYPSLTPHPKSHEKHAKNDYLYTKNTRFYTLVFSVFPGQPYKKS